MRCYRKIELNLERHCKTTMSLLNNLAPNMFTQSNLASFTYGTDVSSGTSLINNRTVSKQHNVTPKNAQNPSHTQTSNDAQTHKHTQTLKQSQTAENPNNEPLYFTIDKPNPLFWCYYVLTHDATSLADMKTNNSEFKIESALKFKLIDKLRKEVKISHTKRTELEADLAGHSIGISTFCALCEAEKLHVLIVFSHERSVYEIGEGNNIHVVHIHKGCVRIEPNSDGAFYLENMYKLPDEKRKLYSIGSYKRDELNDICIKVGLSVEKTMTKAELYEKLQQHFESNNKWNKLT